MMARLNKNNYPFWLFLLLSPFLALRFLLIDQIDDLTKTTRLYWLRALGYLGLLIIWLNLISLGANPPELEDAKVYTGIITKVVTSKGRRPTNAIKLKMKSGEEIRFEGKFIAKNIPVLQQHLGKPITIWSYKRANMFYLKENWFIELEINGQRLKNNWPAVKQRIETSEPGHWLLLGFLIAIVSFVQIWKLLTRKM